MKKGTAEECLSKLPTEAVSGLIFMLVLQSLDSQNWLTQHMRYASASLGYFGLLETAQRSVLTKTLQMCQIFYSEWEAEAPQVGMQMLSGLGPGSPRQGASLCGHSARPACLPAAGKGGHQNKLNSPVQYCLHEHPTVQIRLPVSWISLANSWGFLSFKQQMGRSFTFIFLLL